MPTATLTYTAADGTRFDTEAAAVQYERLVARIAAAMSPLGKAPADVEDGKGWLQHKPDNVRRAKAALCGLIAPTLEDSWPKLAAACRETPDEVHPMGAVGRIICDCDDPFARAWSRFCRIDGQGREHQQPFYALNGPQPEHSCVEDRSS